MTLVQRRLLGLVATLGVAAAAGAVVWWQGRALEASVGDDAARARVLRLTDAKAVRRVELTTPAGSFTLVREGTAQGASAWTLEKPLHTAADASAVDGLLGELVELKRTSTLGDKDEKIVADKALFGLAPARFTVTLSTGEGAGETLLAGKKNSFDGSLYVQRQGDKAVLLVPGALEYRLDEDLFKLRDKRVLAFDAPDVLGLDVTVDGKPAYALERAGNDDWKLTSPRAVAADGVAVQGLLSALSSASATRFVTEQGTAVELAKVGLARPKAAVTLRLRQGAPRTALFSEVTEAGVKKYYATPGGGPSPVVELSSNWVLDKVAVDPDTLRDKRTLPFARDDVATLTVQGGDKTLAFARQTVDGAEHWSLTAPEKAKAQDATLAGLLYRLWNLKAKRIVSEKVAPAELAKLGLDRPALRVTLAKGDGAALGTLRFGKVEGDDQYAMAEGSTRVDLVDAAVARDIPLDPANYKEEASAKK